MPTGQSVDGTGEMTGEITATTRLHILIQVTATMNRIHEHGREIRETEGVQDLKMPDLVIHEGHARVHLGRGRSQTRLTGILEERGSARHSEKRTVDGKPDLGNLRLVVTVSLFPLSD